MMTYDAAMAGVIVAGMVWGALRGITWQLASLASLVLGYVIAFPLSAQLAPHFPGEPVVARALALLATYAGISGGVFLAAWIVRATLRRWKFEAYDRHLGLILGGLEGGLLGIIATVFVVSLAPQARAPIFASPAGKAVCCVLDAVEPVLPGEIRDELAPFWSGSGTGSLAGPGTPSAAPPADAARPGPGDDARGADLGDLVRDGEARVGRAMAEEARRALDRAGRDDDRDIERR